MVIAVGDVKEEETLERKSTMKTSILEGEPEGLGGVKVGPTSTR